MDLNLPLIFLAALAGVTMAVQGTLNAALSKTVGLLEATLIVMFVGLLGALLALYPLGLGKGNLAAFNRAPWYTFLGGILIVVITYAVAASIPRLGAASATTIIVTAQVAAATIIDHLGLFGLKAIPFSWWKILGLALLAVGIRLMLMR